METFIEKAYARWQSEEGKEWSYQDFLSEIRSSDGEFGELIILIGNYDSQICNGGHFQYFDNGFADGKVGLRSFEKRDYTLPAHNRMIELFWQFKLNEKFLDVYKIMRAFEVEYEEAFEEYYTESCEYCDNGVTKDNDECFECGGTGEIEECEYHESTVYIESSLDDRYYKLNDAFMLAFDGVVQDLSIL